MGTVLVFHDVTRLRRLESLRRDFVANVSHELKTPITSIQGFVETLIDGAMESSEDANRFLAIISKQSQRLARIVDDLLSISRLEDDGVKDSLRKEVVTTEEIFLHSVQPCSFAASKKKLSILNKSNEIFKIVVDGHLVEQALSNLFTNAIKYSDQGGEIHFNCEVNGREVVFSVQDFGVGIPDEHFSRLFERFYRVDKARSRKLGGTGLGLAIVKHIAQAHSGRVAVESKVGEGSKFSLHLPNALA